MSLILSGTDGLSDVDGSAATPAIRGTDANTGIFFPAADTIAFAEGGAEVARFDSSGNFGIGETSPTAKLHIGVASAAVNGTKGVRIANPAGTIVMLECGSGGDSFVGTESGSTFNIRTNNAINATFLTSGNVGFGETNPVQKLHFKGSSTTYALAETTGSGTSSGFRMKAGAGTDFTLFTTQGGNQFGIYNNTTSTQPLTIDASGNLGVGVTAPQNKLQVVTTTRPQFSVSYNGTTGLYLEDATNSAWKSWKLSTSFGAGSDLSFVQSTNTSGTPTWAATAAMTLDASGKLLVGGTTAYGSGCTIDGSASSPAFYASGTATTGGAGYQMYSSSLGVNRFYVTWAGQIYATSTSITGISDQTLKTNVRDLDTGLIQVMALKPRRFDWINGDGENIAGFVAQEVEQVLPELVSDYVYNKDEDGNALTKKALKMGDMLPTLVKAIQEQQVLITQLTARITALENK